MPETDVQVNAVDVEDFENQVDSITEATGAYVTGASDVWAVLTCMNDYDTVVGMAASLPGVVIHKADRSQNSVSVAMDKYADEL